MAGTLAKGKRQEVARRVKGSLGLQVLSGSQVKKGWRFGEVPGGFYLKAMNGKAQTELTAAHQATLPVAR